MCRRSPAFVGEDLRSTASRRRPSAHAAIPALRTCVIPAACGQLLARASGQAETRNRVCIDCAVVTEEMRCAFSTWVVASTSVHAC